MVEAAKNICMVASQEDQPCPEKSTVLKPYAFVAPTKLFRSARSSFQLWQKPSSEKSLGEVEGHNNPQLKLQLAISNNVTTQAATNHNNTMENPTLHQDEKTIINGSFATPSAGVNINTGQICEGQASFWPPLHRYTQPYPHRDLGCDSWVASSFNPNLAIMEEDSGRLKRVMANRVYSKKYRLKKTKYITNLENLTRTLCSNIFNIHQEIEKNKNMQRPLLVEHHQLKLQIATLEKDRILKEVEIEKNMAEMKRLRELQMNQQEAFLPSSDSLKTEVDP